MNERSTTRPSGTPLTYIGVILTSATVVVSVLLIILARPNQGRTQLPASGPSNAELEQLILSLSGELRDVQEQVEGLSEIPGDAPVAAHISRLDQTLSQTSERLASLEGAILADPVKAVQLPLLSDQVADLAQRTDAGFAAQRNDVDRVYDILKFSIGALAIGVLSMAITTMFKPRKEPSS